MQFSAFRMEGPKKGGCCGLSEPVCSHSVRSRHANELQVTDHFAALPALSTCLTAFPFAANIGAPTSLDPSIVQVSRRLRVSRLILMDGEKKNKW